MACMVGAETEAVGYIMIRVNFTTDGTRVRAEIRHKGIHVTYVYGDTTPEACEAVAEELRRRNLELTLQVLSE